MNILAIDPGNVQSAYVLMRADDCRPLYFGKVDNGELREIINAEHLVGCPTPSGRVAATGLRDQPSGLLSSPLVGRCTPSLEVPFAAVVIERIQSYGMAVGREVFETCEWVGRFTEEAVLAGYPVHYVYRIEEKRAICHNPNAKDANIRRALIDRFARHDLKNGKGTRKNPDFFYGFHADVWAAFAVGYTWISKGQDELRNGG